MAGDLAGFEAVVEQSEELRAVLHNPEVDSDAKRGVLDALMQQVAPPRSVRRYVNENLGRGADAEKLTLIASHLLSELSDQVSIVLVPARAEVTLRSIEFVPLPGSQASVVGSITPQDLLRTIRR